MYITRKSDELKKEGNRCFTYGYYLAAVDCYSRAIGIQADHALYSNRAMCFLRLGRWSEAARDSQEAVKLCSDYPKAYYRLALAEYHLFRTESARHVLNQGIHACEETSELQALLAEVESGNVSCPSTLGVAPKFVAAGKKVPSEIRTFFKRHFPSNRQLACEGLASAVEAKFDINKKVSGHTLIHMAIFMDDNSIVDALLKCNADPEVRDVNEDNALLCAVRERNANMTRLLLDSGVPVTIVTKKKGSVSALHLASCIGSSSITALLLQHVQTPDLLDHNGNTPLLSAVSAGHLKIVKLLMEANANVHHAAYFPALTPIAWAVMSESIEIVDHLMAHSCDPYAVLLDGRTASDLAITPDFEKRLFKAIASRFPEKSKPALATGDNPVPPPDPAKELQAARRREQEEQFARNIAFAQTNNYLAVWERLSERPAALHRDCPDLHLACTTGSFATAHWLLDEHADPNEVLRGATPLTVGCAHPDVVALLLARRADPGKPAQTMSEAMQTPLYSELLSVESATLLLRGRADVDAGDLSSCQSPLVAASARKNVALVRLLLKWRANTNIECQAKSGGTGTALSFALGSSHLSIDICSMLLASGADPNLPRVGGITPLFRACQNGVDEFVYLLLKHSALPHQLDGDGSPPIQGAVTAGQAHIVRLLLQQSGREYSIDGSFPGGDGARNPLLCSAALHGHAATIVELLAAGADVNVRESQHGSTPLHIACGYRHHECVQLLVDRRAAINIRDDLGRTPLWTCATTNDTTLLDLLIGAGAESSMRTIDGRTPLAAAKEFGAKECSWILSLALQRCNYCGQREPHPKAWRGCAQCNTKYCSRNCQKSDWKAGHKSACPKAAARPTV